MKTPPKLTRRRFLEGAAAGALIGCAAEPEQESPTPDAQSPADTSQDAADTATTAGPVVGIVGVGDDLEGAVRRAIDLAGGLDAIQPGDSVFIKPNAVHGFTAGQPAIVTDNALLKVVIKLVRDRKPSKITVGDRSARFFTSASVFDQTGLRAAAEEAGADEIFAAPAPADAPEEWVLVKPTGWERTWTATDGVLVMRRMVEADHLINLPVCKNHRWAAFSLSLKNFIGGVGDPSRDQMHYVSGDPDSLSRDIAILNQPFSPLLSLLDARSCLVNGGPEGIDGTDVRFEANLLLASSDRIALDAAGAALIQHALTQVDVPEPDEMHGWLTTMRAWELPQLVHALTFGLGNPTPGAVPLVFDEVPPALAKALRDRYLDV